MAKELQTERIGIRATKSEVTMLGELGQVSGFGYSDLIRKLIRSEYQREFGRKLPAMRKRSRSKIPRPRSAQGQRR